MIEKINEDQRKLVRASHYLNFISLFEQSKVINDVRSILNDVFDQND